MTTKIWLVTDGSEEHVAFAETAEAAGNYVLDFVGDGFVIKNITEMMHDNVSTITVFDEENGNILSLLEMHRSDPSPGYACGDPI